MEGYRSRKFIISAGIQVFSSVALAFGWLDGANYASISSAYIVCDSFTNAAEYWQAGGR